MSLKLFILFMTYVLLAYGDDVERKDNAESYITKEAAKELRNKLSAHGTQQDYDYDEILKRIILSVQQPSVDTPEQIVYEKKYFDYLPNDLDSEDVTDEDSTQELVKSYGDLISAEHENEGDIVRRANSRKFKRDLTGHHSRQRRQKYPAASPLQSRYSSESYKNPNPWNPQNNPGKLHVPHNFYLPAFRPGVNNPEPPHNPSGKPTVDFGDRVGGFEEDDTPQRIWGINDINSGSGSSFQRPAPQPAPKPERTPPASTTRRPPGTSNTLESFDGPNEPADLEIEYPPDTFDVPLTTRAPLKKVTVTSNKSPNRKNMNREKDRSIGREASSTTRVPTTTPQPSRTSSRRKPNTSVPNCVLAIVNCCSRYDEIVRTPCFEKYNCTGAFFGRSPCSPDIKAAAFREVEKFSQ